MLHAFSRTESLIGEKGLDTLLRSKVAVFGIGGVGSYVVEALARSGVGNRQLIALRSTIGKSKTQVAKDRIMDINQDAVVHTYDTFYSARTADLFDFSTFDYVVDAIDTVSSKILLIEKAKEAQVPIISSMGTGNKLDPSKFQITDISKTSVCPLAKVMRLELKKRKIKKVKVLFSTELPQKDRRKRGEPQETKGNTNHPVPGSISFVPSVAGLLIAGEVIRDLLKEKEQNK